VRRRTPTLHDNSRRFHRGVLLFYAWGACFVIAAAIIGSVVKAIHGPRSTSGLAASSVQPSPTSQIPSAPQPIRTSRHPRLGSAESAFIAYYGQPNIFGSRSAREDRFLPCGNGEATEPITYQLTVGDIVGPYDDGLKGVNDVGGRTCDPLSQGLPTNWRAMAESFLPADAVKRNRVFDNGSGVYEQLYYSPSVDRATPRYQRSSDCNGDPVPPGTVYIEGNDAFGQWHVAIGGGEGNCF
jgi:hypothetical protein